MHLFPSLGPVALRKLTPERLQTLYSQKLQAGLSPKYVREMHGLVHNILRHAVKWGALSSNPADLVDLPTARRREQRVLSLDDARTLVSIAWTASGGPLVVLALTTGMRAGELVGLKWSDIDWPNHCLYVNRSLKWVTGHGWVENEPKTARSRRRVLLIPLAEEALRRQRTRQAEQKLKSGDRWQAGDWVFTTRWGRHPHQGNVRDDYLLPLLQKAGLPPMRFHDLRHSTATLLFGLGVELKVVQEILGHSHIATTADIYAHMVPHLQAEAMDRLQRQLSAE
ncbi:MAG: tyrosine-type recombinase/integrase [Chloroflexota bacterium]